MNHRQRPPEPPIPDPDGYPLTHEAVSELSRARRAVRQLGAAGWIAAAAAVAIAGIGCYVSVAIDTPARNATARAVVAKPTAAPGVPVRAKSPEYSPVIASSMGDGTWLLGKEIKRGLYAAPGGTACYWERLSDLSGDPDGTIDVGFARRGPQKVQLGDGDFAFTSNGCGTWVMVR